MITVQPWDVSLIAAIEKSIRAADLGVNPSNDGKIIRIPIPPLNEERRRDLVKKLHGVAEDHRWRSATSGAIRTSTSRSWRRKEDFRRRRPPGA